MNKNHLYKQSKSNAVMIDQDTNSPLLTKLYKEMDDQEKSNSSNLPKCVASNGSISGNESNDDTLNEQYNLQITKDDENQEQYNPLTCDDDFEINSINSFKSLDRSYFNIPDNYNFESTSNRESSYSQYNSRKMSNGSNVSGATSWFRERCFFSDGKRIIDYVLAFEDDGHDSDSDSDCESKNPTLTKNQVACEMSRVSNSNNLNSKARKRHIYESNLESLGLEIERVPSIYYDTTKINFVLVHGPFHVLCKQAELLKLKVPVMNSDVNCNIPLFNGFINRCLNKVFFIDMSEELKKRLEVPTTFNTQFIENHLKCYDNYQNKDQFFQRADRAWMVYDLLLRTGYNDGTSKKVQIGIERLLNRGTYCAAYPLHERLSRKDPVIKVSDMTDRELLFKHWGSFKAFFRFQPLDLIKRYFGTKFGLYFAWLGYYTKLLIFPAIIGLIVVIAGISTYHNDIPSNDICGTDGIGSTTFLCPSCEKYCDFTKLSDSCFYSKLTYIFDNNYTVFFAIIMSIWATLFLEGWKRFHAELAWKWGLLDFEIEEEAMRPEFQLKIKTTKLNPVTGKEDPHIPGIQKIIRMICSGITVLFFVCLVLAFAFGIIFYRVICTYTLYKLDANNILRSNVTIVTSMTAASINLVVILSLNYMYTWLAVKLTEMECPRTQTEFDNSYCLKVFLFQWVNYFSSPLYIAFFKGRFNSVPNALDPTDLGSELQITPSMEQCDPAGCMVELVIQLAFIMCGKQFFSGFMEICYPFILNWRRKVKLPSVNSLRAMWSKHNSEVTPINIPIQTDLNSGREKILVKQYEKDFALNSVHHQYLFDEYLEMVIQFGFVTLFVTAFPLAPLFALINNVLEIRMDALKFLSANRRPVPSQSKNIGIWLSILDGISTFAVLVNASVIAFTSDFVPKLFYYFKYEKELYGYMDNSLSYFDASLLNMNITSNYGDVKVCRYRGYIQPTCHFKNKHPELFHANDDCNNEYIAKGDWWQILACRLAFILIFEHLVFVIKILFAYIIPDIPTHILLQLQREKFLNRQAVLNQHEMSKIKKMKDTSNISNSDLLKRAKAQVSSKDVIFESGQVTNEKDLMSSQLQEILTSKNNEASSRLPRKKMSSIVSHKYEEDPSIPGGIQENDNHLHSVSSLDSFYTAN